MILREANKADVSAMQRVRLSVRENVLSDPDRITEDDYVAALDELGRTWVVETDGRIVAFATGYRTGSIWALFVHPDHERSGYGHVLHEAVTGWLWSLGLKRIWLNTSAGTRAESFYTSRGWKRCGECSGGEIRLELSEPFSAGPASRCAVDQSLEEDGRPLGGPAPAAGEPSP